MLLRAESAKKAFIAKKQTYFEPKPDISDMQIAT